MIRHPFSKDGIDLGLGRFGFAHVLDLSALDVGLFLYMARRRGQKRGSMEEDDN